MSLIRQVWLLLLGTLLLALAGSVVVNVVSTRDTLGTQLTQKDADNAQALAIALSQQRGDVQKMSLLLAAQFDTGHYRQIRFAGIDGTTIFDRAATAQPTKAPRWFVKLVPIDSSPGMAQVSDGWQALGSVTLSSQSAYAYDDLWSGGLESAAWMLGVGLAAALLAMVVVRGIRRPLDATIGQAEALMAGEFVQLREPLIPELSRLTRAMNSMVSRVKTLFEAQAFQVETLRRQAHHDALTGLANRSHFLRLLDAALERDDGPTDGGLVLLRLRDLAEANRLHGHDAADRAILAIAQALQVYPTQVAGCFVGRLNGADFALYLPAAGVARETAQALAEALRVTLPAFGSAFSVALGSTDVRRGTSATALMSIADAALAAAESRGVFAAHHSQAETSTGGGGDRAWRTRIAAALSEGRARLVEFPVMDSAGSLLHLECPMRLQLDAGVGAYEPAMVWLPHALRGRLTPVADRLAVKLALQAIEGDGRARCVNVAPASLTDSDFLPALREQLAAKPEAARLLSMELAENVALERVALLQHFVRQLRPLGVMVGLEHAGAQLARIERLYEIGLDYVKLDASVTRGVAGDPKAADFIRNTATLLHALSVQIHAEGVTNADDARALWGNGIDGVTGPWVGAVTPVG